MASDFGSLSYCYELPVNGKGAKVAKDCYFCQSSLGMTKEILT